MKKMEKKKCQERKKEIEIQQNKDMQNIKESGYLIVNKFVQHI